MLAILTLSSFVAYAQRSEGAANAHVNGRTIVGSIPKLTSRNIVDGVVVVSIIVDRYGVVTEAIPGAEGSTITNESVLNATRTAALKAHFNQDATASAVQTGTITYTFVSIGKEETDENCFKFMGIPIDGSEQDMIAALKAKGFESDYSDAYLTGIFDGVGVRVYISTNHGVVDRIKVFYPSTRDSNETRVRYNNLLSRMNRNAKYVSVCPRDEIPAGESVDWNSHINSKYYDAAYFYLVPGVKPEEWVKDFNAAYKKKYTKPVKDLSYEELEDVLFCLPMSIRNSISGIVWLAITDYDHININYDNLQNRPRGEDL